MSTSGSSSNRIDTLDATKGILVVFMVIYHSLNYSTQYQLAFKYLSFLPPSFIVITGFLLSSIYLARYAATDVRMHTRLITRGAKLLVLFTALNIAAQMIHSKNYHNTVRGPAYFFQHWIDVYAYGDTRLAAFEILLPISYLLLLAPLLILASQLHRVVLPLLALSLLGASMTMERHGGSSAIFDLMIAGVVGMWVGGISFQRLEHLRRWLPAALVAYVAYAVIGQIWGQPFVLQLAGAVLALAAVYGFSLHLSRGNWIKERLVRLGQYSLLSYIAQIGILQVLSHFAGRPEPVSWGLFALMTSTLILTALVVEAVAWSRARLALVNGAYQAVFA